MKTFKTFLFLFFILHFSFTHAQTSREEALKFLTQTDTIDGITKKIYEDLAQKYHGRHQAVVLDGPTLQPDELIVEDGVVQLFFKGAKTDPKEFENGAFLPLTH